MAWIESHESLPTHPKTKRMCRILKISPVVAVGHLHFLWWWAMSHAQDGALDKYTPDDVADACSWTGDVDSFFKALVESKFIDQTNTGYEIHDWFVYAGKLIALRQKDAERKRMSRGKKPESEGSPSDIPRTSDGGLPESIRDLDLNLNHNQKKDHILTASEILKEINQYKVTCKGTFQLDEVAAYIGIIEDDLIIEAIKRSEGRNVGYVKSILESIKANPQQYRKKEVVEKVDTKSLTGEEWAKAAGFGGGT